MFLFFLTANMLQSKEQIFYDQYLTSENQCFKAAFAQNGNFQVKHVPSGEVLWEAGIPSTVYDSNVTLGRFAEIQLTLLTVIILGKIM
jgi:hypothetical protein